MRGPVMLLKDAWGIFASNPKLFIGIYAIPAVVTIAWSLFVPQESEAEILTLSGAELAIVFGGMILLTILNVLMGIAMIQAVIDPVRTTVQSAYTFGRKHFWAYLWVSFLVGITTAVGFLLLIIPGIIVAVWLCVSYFVLLIENKRGVQALKASRAYVKGKWWKVFGRLAFLALVAMAFSIVIVVITAVVSTVAGEFGAVVVSMLVNAVVVPVALAYSYGIYKDLASAPQTEIADVPVS